MNDRDMCCGPAWSGAYRLEMASNRFLLESDQASWTPEAASSGSVEQHMCDAVICLVSTPPRTYLRSPTSSLTVVVKESRSGTRVGLGPEHARQLEPSGRSHDLYVHPAVFHSMLVSASISDMSRGDGTQAYKSSPVATFLFTFPPCPNSR
ncbi:hypothetical protein OH76DRAFT_1237599 [Lentinus brumalis]|uniref:Uncharacterized protein n=1 Tax=Lentinus brumalis TaxID=2498619 RepID=A0A371CSC9_9APHY|nr:hypothetical protein OH76DRAFT_1237599 [Polyporus brumalis]